MNTPCTKSDAAILDRLFEVLLERKKAASPDSYTASLFEKGLPKIHTKVGEEAGELIEASETGNRAHIIHEAADLVFHCLVLLCHHGIRPEDVYGELARRWGISGIAEKNTRGQIQ